MSKTLCSNAYFVQGNHQCHHPVGIPAQRFFWQCGTQHSTSEVDNRVTKKNTGLPPMSIFIEAALQPHLDAIITCSLIDLGAKYATKGLSPVASILASYHVCTWWIMRILHFGSRHPHSLKALAKDMIICQ